LLAETTSDIQIIDSRKNAANTYKTFLYYVIVSEHLSEVVLALGDNIS
jgi:hypothetical protein